MNPWMQTVWPDVHTTLIGYIRDALGNALPEDLVARAEEGVALTTLDGDIGKGRADVAIVEHEPWKKGERPIWSPDDDKVNSDTAVPVLIHFGEIKERWIEIHTSRGELITVIELTSPANKSSEGRKKFQKKLDDLVMGGVNTVEIDLIRGGHSIREKLDNEWNRYPYFLLSEVEGGQPETLALFPCDLREPLPAIRIPLRFTDPDVVLDLQPLIDRCYEKGRYWTLDYSAELNPPLSSEDAEWANALLKEAELVE